MFYKWKKSYPFLIVGSTLAVFSGALSCKFCEVDDPLYIVDVIRQGFTLDGLHHALTDVSQSIWMPITCISYMLDYSAKWGLPGMHAQSLIWHSLNAILLYILLLLSFGNSSRWPHFTPIAALCATALWAIHPMRVESVVWLASRKDVISTTFLLVALILWTRDGWKRPFTALLVIATGVMAKPSVMVFPLFAFALDWFVTGKRKPHYLYWAAFALGGLIALEAGWAQSQSATGYSQIIPLWYKILNALAAITIYIGDFIWPRDLAIPCMIRYPALPRFSLIGTVTLIPIIGWGISVLIRRFKLSICEGAAFAGISLFLVSLGPFLGIAGFGYHAYADRFTVLPAIGISICLAAIWRGRWFAPALVTVLLALGLETMRQTQFWKDNIRLLTRTLEVDSEKNACVHYSLGMIYWRDHHDMQKAFEHLDKAMRYAPTETAREHYAQGGHILVEAAYASGHPAEAEDWCYWMRKWNHRQVGSNGMLVEYLFVDSLLTLNSKMPRGEKVRTVSEALERMKRAEPDSYITKDFEYQFAKWLGDTKRERAALEQMANDPENDANVNRTWAKLELSRLTQ